MWKLILCGVVGGLVGAVAVAVAIETQPEEAQTLGVNAGRPSSPASFVAKPASRMFTFPVNSGWVDEWGQFVDAGALPLDSGELKWTGLYASPSESLAALCVAIESRKIAASDASDDAAAQRLGRMMADADIARAVSHRMIRVGDIPDKTELLLLLEPVFNQSAN